MRSSITLGREKKAIMGKAGLGRLLGGRESREGKGNMINYLLGRWGSRSEALWSRRRNANNQPWKVRGGGTF